MAAKAVKEGTLQRELQQQAYTAELAIQRGERPIVGVNMYESSDSDSIELPVYPGRRALWRPLSHLLAAPSYDALEGE